jgi:HlyD family secretion protein
MAQPPTIAVDTPWPIEAEASLPQGSLRRIAILSLLTILVGFGGLTTWAGYARVESAVPATGVIVASGKRKTVSLVDSGILKELLVQEGDKVAAGQVLLHLDDAQPRAARLQASVLYWSAVARAARLAAEAADRRELPPSLVLQTAAAADPAVAAAVDAETQQFQSRWRALDASTRVQERKIAQQEAQLNALRAQIASTAVRMGLVQEELRGVDFLMSRGLSTKPRQLELRRNEAEMRGAIGQYGGQYTTAMQVIAQVESEVVSTAETRRSDIARERAETQAAQADAEQRLSAANDLLQKREITAPEAGTVTDFKYFTPGSSIVAGQPVMDLVPDSQRLLIEGTVAPFEVEHLAIGQRVNVRLTAYKAHRVPVVSGHLTYVGADRQMDANNLPVFLVRAELDPGVLRDKPGIVLMPGMPADILIVNGARSVLDFLISPITDSIGRAMKEE